MIHGTEDLQTTVEGAREMAELNDMASFEKIDSMNHVLRKVTSDSLENGATYLNPNLPLYADFIGVSLVFK